VNQQKTVTDAWFDRGVGIACLCLVLAIAYSLSNLTWLFLNGPEEPEVGVVESISMGKASAVHDDSTSVASIRRWHLFGEVGKQAPKPKPVVRKNIELKAPETNLRLILNGVFRSEVEEESSAIVAEKGRAGKLYKVGEKLPGNATLETVYENRIILNRSGRLETLHFPKNAPTGLASTTGKNKSKKKSSKLRGASSKKSSSRRSNGRQIIKNPKSRLGQLVNRGRLPSPKELVSSLHADAQSDAGTALKELGFQAVPMADGGGYRVGSSAPAEMLQAVGLRQDDRVLSVNGHQLGDIEADKGLFDELAAGGCEGDVRIEIERGPRRFSVNVPCM
jgi:general secretion pathway protein C